MPLDHIAYWKKHLLPHYLSTGAVREVPYPPWRMQLISAAHLDPKAKEGFRLVLDLCIVNKWFAKVPIKFETLQLLRRVVQNLMAVALQSE